jgi:glucokinase
LKRSSPAATKIAPLVADIGGTHSRCALVIDGRPGPAHVVRNDQHPDIASMLREAIQALAPAGVTHAALAIAAPVRGDDVHMTNRGWRFSVEGLRTELGLQRLDVINDFTAIALALPHLTTNERVAIGGGAPLSGAAVAVLGPGTGLGVSALIPCEGDWAAVSGEGGHVTLPAADEFESRIIARAHARYEHVSAERLVSGPGLFLLHELIAEELGAKELARTPEEVSARAARGDALARRTLDTFFSLLATVAADVALTFGALGGVYLAGGILPSLRAELLASPFRARFESKGRYREYLGEIPTCLVIADQPGLIGLAGMVSAKSAA